MTNAQRLECEDIIDTASKAAAAAAALGKTAMVPIHVTMVLSLAAALDVSLTKAAAASIVERELSSTLISDVISFFIPIKKIYDVGSAYENTYDFGWSVARDFDA